MEENKIQSGNPMGSPNENFGGPMGDYSMGPEKTENKYGGTYPISPNIHAPATETEEKNANPPLNYVFLLATYTCLLVDQEDVSSCGTKNVVFLLNKNTCLLVEQDDMSSWSTRRRQAASCKLIGDGKRQANWRR